MVNRTNRSQATSPTLALARPKLDPKKSLAPAPQLRGISARGLGYCKDLETHKAAVALFLGVYNFVRKHATLQTTPAVAAGVEWVAWDLERVVEMTEAFMRRKEDAKFDEAFAEALGE